MNTQSSSNSSFPGRLFYRVIKLYKRFSDFFSAIFFLAAAGAVDDAAVDLSAPFVVSSVSSVASR
eukprot:m.510618 g.510618  ORF g.510618 m.510618 type:complete len:65 (-) comp57419_c0_seq8:2213-2407(-)